jgi:aminoglycoside 3-N-acetyltransferase I
VPYKCRALSGAEIGAFRQLLRVFGEAFGEADTYEAAAPDDRYLAELLDKPHFIAVAALHDRQVVGGLAAYVLEKFEQARREIYIYDLAVAGPHRRKGVATALIQELKHIAKTRGAYVIYVQADRGDEPAIRLYESLGRRESVYHFDIPVGDKSAQE